MSLHKYHRFCLSLPPSDFITISYNYKDDEEHTKEFTVTAKDGELTIACVCDIGGTDYHISYTLYGWGKANLNDVPADYIEKAKPEESEEDDPNTPDSSPNIWSGMTKNEAIAALSGIQNYCLKYVMDDGAGTKEEAYYNFTDTGNYYAATLTFESTEQEVAMYYVLDKATGKEYHGVYEEGEWTHTYEILENISENGSVVPPSDFITISYNYKDDEEHTKEFTVTAKDGELTIACVCDIGGTDYHISYTLYGWGKANLNDVPNDYMEKAVLDTRD